MQITLKLEKRLSLSYKKGSAILKYDIFLPVTLENKATGR